MTNNLEKLKLFMKDNDWIDCQNLSENSSIEYDLGITGDDAIDFINDFALKFNVDICKFDFDKYFYPEGGMDLLTPIINMFKKDKIPLQREPLKIHHLITAMQLSKLE